MINLGLTSSVGCNHHCPTTPKFFKLPPFKAKVSFVLYTQTQIVLPKIRWPIRLQDSLFIKSAKGIHKCLQVFCICLLIKEMTHANLRLHSNFLGISVGALWPIKG